MTAARAQARRAAGAGLGGRGANLMIALFVMLIVLALREPNYFTIDNVRVVALNSCAVGIAALGMAFLMIAGGIDLSIGSIFVAAGFAAGGLAPHVPAPVAVAAGIAVGAAIGLVNGLLVWRIQVSPIIVTLGSLTLIIGIMTVITGGESVAGMPPSFLSVGQGTPLGIPTEIWTAAGLAIVAGVILSQTTIGAHVYALGGSREASEVSGVRVRRLLLGLFALAGASAGLAGVLTTARFGVANLEFGTGFELDVITAVILGGVAFTGGVGTIGGVVLAVIFLNVVDSGLIALGVDPSYSDIVKGGALIVSVGLEQLAQERNASIQRAVAIAEMAEAEELRRREGDLASTEVAAGGGL